MREAIWAGIVIWLKVIGVFIWVIGQCLSLAGKALTMASEKIIDYAFDKEEFC